MNKQEIIGSDAWEWHEFVKMQRRRVEESFLELGRGLYEIKAERYYEAFQHPTFESYLGDPEVDLSRSLAYRLIRIYEIFQLMLERPPGGLLEAGHSKLDLISPYVHSNNADEWIGKAAALSRSDLRLELKEAFGDDAVPPLPVDYRVYSRMYHRAYRQLREWIKRKGEYDDFKRYNRNRRERARKQHGDVGEGR